MLNWVGADSFTIDYIIKNYFVFDLNQWYQRTDTAYNINYGTNRKGVLIPSIYIEVTDNDEYDIKTGNGIELGPRIHWYFKHVDQSKKQNI